MSRILTFFILLLFILSSCNRRINLTTYESVKPRDIVMILDSSGVEFQELKARFKIRADLNGEKKTFNADIRWDWNDKIWMSFSIFGIEGVRVEFTPDSVKVLNKIDNEFYYGDYTSLAQLSKVELSFYEIEQLLLGQLLSIEDKKPEVRLNGGLAVLTLQDQKFDARVNVDIKTVSIQQYWINSITSAKRLEVTLSDYQQIGYKKWPNKRDYHIVSGDTYLKVDATSQKLVLNEKLEYPFHIHPKYQRIPL